MAIAGARVRSLEARAELRLGRMRVRLLHLSLTTQFLLANLVVFVGAMLVEIRSVPGQGTVVRTRWPLGEVEEAWPSPSE